MKCRRLRSEVYYAEPIERVWRALTDPAEIRRWLTRGDFKLRRGHRFKWKEPEDSAPGPMEGASCEVAEVHAPERLAYRVELPDDQASVVTWRLERLGEGTRVIIEQELTTGFEPRLHPGVTSLDRYRRNRAMLKLQSDLESLFRHDTLALASAHRRIA
jgi:uncharacterized protein YndB with AHSA1/START domain